MMLLWGDLDEGETWNLKSSVVLLYVYASLELEF